MIVVHEHRLYREMLAHLFEHTAGVGRVATAATVGEAVDICREEPIDVAVVHADTIRGGRPEAAHQLADELPRLRVLVVSGSADEERLGVRNGHRVWEVDTLERLVWAVTGRSRFSSDDPEPGGRRDLAALSGIGPERWIIPRLTPREVEVLEALAAGLSTKEGARALHISPQTLRSHVKSILSKLGAHSKLEAMTIALRQGLISLPPGG